MEVGSSGQKTVRLFWQKGRYTVGTESAASSGPVGTGGLILLLLWQDTESRMTEPEAQCWVSSSVRQTDGQTERENDPRSENRHEARTTDGRLS